MQNDKRLTIGLLGTPMHAGRSLWIGMADAAEVHDVNLIVFLGGAVMTEALKNTVRYGLAGLESAAVLYDLISPDYLDGLVIWGGAGAGLGIYLDHEDMDAFFRRFDPLPIINYEKIVDGIPSILTDTATGMRELLLHLIEVHGCRRIALIRGPKPHFESNERHRAYIETLAEYGIPLDSQLVCPPCEWGKDEGAKKIRLLMSERGLRPGIDFDAVVTTEGQYAAGVIEELKAWGVHVPNDVAVAGYNDTPEARVSMPGITIMHKPFYDSGWKALELMLDVLAGKPVPPVTWIPSEIMLRRSCGCWPQALQEIDQLVLTRPKTSKLSLSDRFAAHRQDILAVVACHTWASSAVIERLVDALARDLSGEHYRFLSVLEDALQHTPYELERWHSILSTLHQHVLRYLISDEDMRFRFEGILQQARILVQQAAQKFELNLQLEDLLLALRLREVGKRLLTTLDMPDLMDIITEELPRLGVPGCYLSLYESPQPYTYPQEAPEWSTLILAFNAQGRIHLPEAGTRFRSRQLVPDHILPEDKARTLVVVPLYFRQEQFGFALVETGPKKGMVYAELWQLISSALQIVLLMKEQLALAVESERTVILKNFIQGMGHEFKTPLSIMNTSLYLLNQQADSEKQARHIANLETQITTVQQLVDAMLKMSRLDGGDAFKLMPMCLSDLLSQLQTKLFSAAERKAITLSFEVDSLLPSVQADMIALHDALYNIIHNAIRFTPEGGKVIVHACVHDDRVVINIVDTGIGIEPENLPHIFERFYRVDEARTDRGVGLGLSIANKIIEMHEGSIDVESTPDKGTTFKVSLPVRTQ